MLKNKIEADNLGLSGERLVDRILQQEGGGRIGKDKIGEVWMEVSGKIYLPRKRQERIGWRYQVRQERIRQDRKRQERIGWRYQERQDRIRQCWIGQEGHQTDQDQAAAVGQNGCPRQLEAEIMLQFYCRIFVIAQNKDFLNNYHVKYQVLSN